MSTFAVNFGDFSDALITFKMSFLQIFLMFTALSVALPAPSMVERAGVWGKKKISEASEEGTEDKLGPSTENQTRRRLSSAPVIQAELHALEHDDAYTHREFFHSHSPSMVNSS